LTSDERLFINREQWGARRQPGRNGVTRPENLEANVVTPWVMTGARDCNLNSTLRHEVDQRYVTVVELCVLLVLTNFVSGKDRFSFGVGEPRGDVEIVYVEIAINAPASLKELSW
jgi:hypothetical protein